MLRISLPILALVLLVITALLYVGLGGVGYLRMQAVLNELTVQHRAEADNELRDVAKLLRARIDAALQELSEWEELRQQFSDASYYTYWKTQRLHNSVRLPSYVIAAELYNAEGVPFSTATDSLMPRSWPTGVSAPMLLRRDSRDYLLLAVPVIGNDAEQVLGYFAAIVEIKSALAATQRLHYLDVDSLRSIIPDGEQFVGADFIEKFRFDVLPSREAANFKQLLLEFFYQIAGAALLILWIFYSVLIGLVGLPLRKLSKHIDRLRNEQTAIGTEIGEHFALRELEKVRSSLNEYQSRLEVVHRGLDRKNQRLWKLAHHDSLTGCLNRRAFEDDWHRLVKLHAGRTAEVSLVLLDCNHFKAINDTYGHSVGDEVLKGIVLTVRKILNESDRLYRIAGDEFAMIFMDAGADHANEIAQRCMASIGQHAFAQFGVREPVRISIGIAHTSSGDTEDLMGLYRHANIAMFNAKRPGGRGVAIYSQDMSSGIDAALSSRAAAAIDEAINTGKNIVMHYQSVVSLPDCEVTYYEALVRVRDGDVVMKPEEFFLQVETRHLDAEFDQAVFHAIHADLYCGKIPEGSGLSINISAASLVSPDIETRLAVFAPYFKRNKFILEVTETALITQLQLASERLQRLRKLGFLVALDDFGSGYSSLRYLADMPVDVVKFDISLIHALCESNPRSDMLAQLVSLVKQPGYTLVAEGIESNEMLERIIELGFDYAQGFLFGYPDRSFE